MTAEERAQAIIDAFGDAVDWDEMHKLITLAIKAAVEEEQNQWLLALGGMMSDHRTKLIGDSIADAIDAERRRLIPLVCPACEEGAGMPWGDTYGGWFHASWYECHASPIYEAIRNEGPGDD